MTSPMPRDSLGRIVYEGDCVVGWTVDLAASPERTNYERYFADLGTRAEIIRAIVSACGECDECPCTIGDIIELVKRYETVGCFAPFCHWLDEKAVI